jgi:NADH-quinone oxidoreductase subunit L
VSTRACCLDPAVDVLRAAITGVGHADPRLLDRLHGARPDRRRFFAYLNLFVAAMLLLVLADSYLLLYVGWEGVGLASYLLIGFWSFVPAYATAAKKAFVVNRVGDFGLSLAIMIMFVQFGSVDFEGVFAGADGASEGALTAIGLLLLLGACGKSAQFPLQSWLLDAMAGPTRFQRSSTLPRWSRRGSTWSSARRRSSKARPTRSSRWPIVGAVTLVFGAIIGLREGRHQEGVGCLDHEPDRLHDAGRRLGPVGYAFAIFHLLTHGFFKAGLFLGAGSVMHGMGDQVDMRRFGGLSAVMKITWATIALGWLAIIGFPGLSGFWSKDKIIEDRVRG